MANGTCSVVGCGKVETLRRGKCYKHYWEEHGSERANCTHEGCGRSASRRNLCGRHYKQWQKLNGPPCTVKQCPNRSIAHGYCNAHYKAWREFGDPLARSPRRKCAWGRGCDKEILVSRSSTGMCAYHATKVWKKTNAERVNEHNRRYNAKNTEMANAWRQKWADANPDRRAEYAAVRRARLLGQFVERVYRSVVFKRDKGRCGICHGKVDPANWHLDHIVPISRGGEHGYANVQVAHPFCNISKGARLIEHQMALL